jgi:hypothetical protein
MMVASAVLASVLTAFGLLACTVQILMPHPHAFPSAPLAVFVLVVNVVNVILAAASDPLWAVVFGLSALFALLDLINRHRDKFRRLAGAIGEKARQRRAALVRTMRQRSRPRPVLRPGLQGAR